MMPTHFVVSAVLVILAVAGCARVDRQTESRLPTSAKPFFLPDSRDQKVYETLGHETEQLIANCASTRSCDRAHFLRGLVALYEDREVAMKHFQDAIAAAPNSHRASSSLFWLQILDEAPAGAAEDGRFSHATLQLLRNLVDREQLAVRLLREADASQVPALQRELKARDKKLEDLTKQLDDVTKQLDDVTKQLDALKQIDREMQDKSLPGRPSSKTTPSLKQKESP